MREATRTSDSQSGFRGLVIGIPREKGGQGEVGLCSTVWGTQLNKTMSLLQYLSGLSA